ncbi:MAG: hypothetical protein JSR86_02305 [Proteobacteria bacterium]|nr:hypothetical protein [Pseudomonadota bacterium]
MANWTRRRLSASLAAAFAGGGFARASALPPEAPLFKELGDFDIPPHLQRIATSGHGRPGLGGGVYRRCAPAPANRARAFSADGACWELADLQVAPEQTGAAGDGRDDDHDALQAAQALARPMVLGQGRDYRVSSTLSLGVPVSGAGRITAGPGFRGDVLIHGRGAFRLKDATLDGTGLPRPLRRWIGAGDPAGCAIFLEGRPGSPLDQPQLDGVTIRNTPGGGLMAKYAQGIRIWNFRAQNVQNNPAFITSAVIELYRCDDGELRDCDIRNYGWKGYSLGACKRTVATNCLAEGGNPGHAAHYLDDCEDCGFVNCRHSGGGYAAKASNARRVWFHGYRSSGSAGGLQVQSCHDVEARDIEVVDSIGAAFVVSASTAGPLVGCRLSQARAAWTGPPRTGQIGLMLTANGARDSQVSGVALDDFEVSNGYFGVYAEPSAACRVEIAAANVRIAAPAQYGMILFAAAVALRGGEIEGAPGFPALAVYSNAGDTGGAVTLSGLTLTGLTPTGSSSMGAPGRAALIEIGGDGGRPAAFSDLAIRDVVGRGGRALLVARLTGAGARAASAPVQVALRDDIALDLAAPLAVDLTFVDGATGSVAAQRNRFATRAGAPGQIRLGPRAALVSTRLDGNRAEIVWA